MGYPSSKLVSIQDKNLNQIFLSYIFNFRDEFSEKPLQASFHGILIGVRLGSNFREIKINFLDSSKLGLTRVRDYASFSAKTGF